MKRSLAAAAALLVAALAPRAVADEGDSGAPTAAERREGWDYEVQPGDTLSEIAVRLEVTVDDLCRWNDGLDPDRIRRGQRLRILDGRRRIEHVVARGETVSAIAVRWEVDVADLLRWNEGLRRDRIHVGQTVRIYTAIPESRSQSVGTPQRGHLVEGRRLPRRHPAFEVREPSRAWGTDETVRWIVEAYEALREADPQAPPVAIHDLSRREGGRLQGHHSHRSGRDADIAYFRRGATGLCRFRTLGPRDLDATRQWRLFAHWIRRGQVEAIFMDYALQEPLYRAAEAAGVPRRERDRIFQYPRGADTRVGLIRHHPRHANHFHIRFVCHESDPECR